VNLRAQWKFVLYAVADGDVDATSTMQLCEHLLSAAARSDISKLLIDARFVTGTLCDTERVQIGEALADYASKLSPKPRLAVIGHAPTFNRLAVTIARRLGLDVELFENIPDALEWLRRDKPLGASAGAR
jgi:hypothetical protein